ncbi:MAG: type II secretion system minor pseudopilin GspI [Burkholderiaceae bacterium]|nr:type II secretion system minor pseudopilin GspI [Burkholderiaceae bacterium]
MKTSFKCGVPRRTRNPSAGFTLVEVLVALAITAIALIAGLRATAALTDNADRQGAVLLAQLCAENKLIELRMSRQLPAVGDFSSDCMQASRTLQVTQTVRSTPNPNFRRVDAAVSENGNFILRLVSIIGRN